MTLTILIPVYNEERTVGKTIQKVLDLSSTHTIQEIILIDDGSTDTSLRIMQELADNNKKIRILQHVKNKGKETEVQIKR